VSQWASTEQVWEEQPDGRTTLKYAVGDPIPEEEAKRQGQLGKKAVKEEAVEDKAVEAPAATKAPTRRRKT